MNFEFRIRNKAEVPVQRLLDKRQSIYVDQGQSDLPNYRSQSAKCTLENCSFRICFPPRLLLHSCWPLSHAEHSSQDAFLFTVTSILKNLSLKGIYLRICKRNNIIFPVDFLCIIFFFKNHSKLIENGLAMKNTFFFLNQRVFPLAVSESTYPTKTALTASFRIYKKLPQG